MKNVLNLTIKAQYLEEFQDGYPLLIEDSIENIDKVKEEGTLLNLFDSKKKFVAKAYYGRQNKGFGWVLSNQKDEKIDTAYFANKLKEAISYRKEFFEDLTTTAFRVFNGEGDKVGGLTIDYFDGYYLITWYSLGIYTFKDEIIEALKSEVSYKSIYQKKRFDTKGQYLGDENDYICGDKCLEPIIVKENGVNFAVYLDDGPMVGIFLDQKEVRKTIRDKYAKGKTVLNTFSYTGAFSVYASLGGAKQTTSVDLANRSKAKTIEQFGVNGIDSSKENIIVEDVFNYFKYAVKKNLLFDMVVVDPPSFARGKKHAFSVAKDYTKLLKEIIQITNKGGIIVASTNYANLSMRKFKDFIDKAFKELNGKYSIEELFTLPKDFKVDGNFKEGDYLKVLFIKKIR